ncbi:MAG: hypothetical protein Q4A56_05265 [Porphyromonadaceae bacterium]|nr:hypothetical protein [Porphyromonadaceae bacterium]
MGKSKITDFSFLGCKAQDYLRKVKRFQFFKPNLNKSPMIVALVDGRNFHGGFTDRLKGMVSLFHFSRIKQMDFRISHTFPFELSDYLEPNQYDWRIEKDELPNNFFQTSFVNLVKDGSIERYKTFNSRNSLIAYANRDVVPYLNDFYHTTYSWSELYKTLFRPTDRVKSLIDNNRQKLGDSYIAAHFRFVGMFGDFNETPYKHIDEHKKRHIFETNVEFVKQLAVRFAGKKIFVASDSQMFIDSVCNIDNVYTLSGDIVHIDHKIGDCQDDAFMRILIDFYLIAGAEKIFSIGTDEMYKSELPLYASKIYDSCFERIAIK